MHISPNDEDWKLAREVHSLFKAKPGSDHIASDFALAHFSALVRVHPVKSVLEFGAGIGTMTYLLLSRLPDARIVCAERNEWCREQFEANIPADWRPRVTLLPVGRPRIDEVFDLAIVDGPVSRKCMFLRAGSFCFGEGNRGVAKREILDALSKDGMTCDVTMFQNDAGPWKLRWQMTRFGFKRPMLKRKKKGCWIGRVERATAP